MNSILRPANRTSNRTQKHDVQVTAIRGDQTELDPPQKFHVTGFTILMRPTPENNEKRTQLHRHKFDLW